MSWVAKESDIYERPLGEMEQSMVPAGLIEARHLYSREPNLIYTIVEFAAPYEEDRAITALRDGWKALRLLQSPDIATAFRDGHKQYSVVSLDQLDSWARDTFIVLPHDQSIHAAIARMQLPTDWLPFCYLLPQQGVPGLFHAKLIFFISHWRTEGTGCLRLLHHLFRFTADLLVDGPTREALASYVPGSEIPLLTPSLEEIVMPGGRPTSAAAQARVDADFARFYASQPSVTFPTMTPPAMTPSHMRLHQRIYTRESTDQLVYTCKTYGITVTAAVHAAYLAAVWQVAEPSTRSLSYSAMIPAQIRSRLHQSSRLRDQGAWCTAQQLLVTVPPGQDFLTRARQIRQQYRRSEDPEWLHEDMRAITEARLKYFISASEKPSGMPWFSSLGFLDRGVISPRQGQIQIQNILIWSDFLSPGVTLMVWTFDGQLNLQFAWNEAFHTDNQIKQAIEVIETTLDTGLSVPLDMQTVRLVDC